MTVKAPPMIIFKAAPAPAGREYGHKRTVTYKIHHNVPDEWDNQYPDKSLCYVTVSNTANSSGELTLDYLKKVCFPAAGAIDDVLSEPSGLLLGACPLNATDGFTNEQPRFPKCPQHACCCLGSRS